MVCRMKSHQGRSSVFSCFAGENAFLDGFLVVFTVVRPLVWLLDPVLLISLICHTPLLLFGVNMSTRALFHDEIAKTTDVGVSD